MVQRIFLLYSVLLYLAAIRSAQTLGFILLAVVVARGSRKVRIGSLLLEQASHRRLLPEQSLYGFNGH